VIERNVSGGQTGAGRAALDYVIAAGISYGGRSPEGRFAEDGLINARCFPGEIPQPLVPFATVRNRPA